MLPFDRHFIKTCLQQTGTFPVVRSIYRKISPRIKRQRDRELMFYGSIIPQKSLCFDIGANLGQRSSVFVELGSRVIIVEPNDNCFGTLRYEFSKNDKVWIVPKAVGAKEGETIFFSHGTDSTASVNPNWDYKVFGSDRGQKSRTVPMTTIDALISRFGKPHFIKVDVEGFEMEVLRGMSNPVPVLSLEYHHDDIKSISDCLSYLKSMSPLSIRASNMDCEWLTERTSDLTSCLSQIEAVKASGDLVVWSDK